MSKLRLSLLGAIAFSTLTLARPAAAADALSLSRDTPSFYVYGAPVFFALPIGDDDVTDAIEISYEWGLGLGGMFAVGDSKSFGIGIGFGFEHNPATLDPDVGDFCDAFNLHCEIHAFRFVPELRLGGIIDDQLFVYGFVAPGLGLVYTKFDGRFVAGNDDVDPGFNLGFGGGVQYVVYKGLFFGGDLGFDFGFYSNDDTDFGSNDYNVFAMDLKGLVGYYF